MSRDMQSKEPKTILQADRHMNTHTHAKAKWSLHIKSEDGRLALDKLLSYHMALSSC